MGTPITRSKNIWMFGLILVSFFYSNIFAANTFYVSLSGSNIAPYNSWATATTSIQTAINAANTGDVVLVDDGTFVLSNTINLIKDITVKSLNGYSFTTIDGNNLKLCFQINNADAIVDGFTITKGYNPSGFGGAVNIVSGGTIQNCYISNSQARDGGGVAIDNSGLVFNCIITGNKADNNNNDGYGGGVRMLNGGITRNCLVYGNTSVKYGGGINVWQSGSIQSCTIYNNTAPYGAGVRCRNNSIMENTISFFNNGSNWETSGTGYTFNSNCTTPALPNGTGNITSDPQFTDASSNNFNLLATSPAIDAGFNQTWMTTALDLNGNSRIFGIKTDIGALEFKISDPPDLISPVSMSKNVSVTPTFTWSATTNATSYTLELSEDPTYTQNLKVFSGISTSSFTITEPLKFGQIYFWRVKSNLSDPIYSTSYIFVTNLKPPVLLTPGSNYLNPIQPTTNYPTNITFRWRNSPVAYMYKIQITLLSDVNFDNPIIDTWAGYGDTSYTASNLLNWTNYLWRVYADNPTTSQRSEWSEKFIFMTKLAPPVLISPAVNSLSQSINPTLTWEIVPGAMFYNVEIYSDLNCSNLVAQYSVNTTAPIVTSVNVTNNLANNTKYFWKVKATHVVSESNYSEVGNFTTIKSITPYLSWPLNAAQLNGSIVNFSWYINQYEPGVKYDLIYSTDVNFSTQFIVENLGTTTYSLNNLLPGTKYYWKVRSKIGDNIASYSTTESFITYGNTTLLSPNISWPTGGNTVYTLQQNLLWYLNNLYPGLTYEVELRVGNIANLTGVPTITNINNCSVTVNLVQGTQYVWQVRSKLGTEYSAWSTPATFISVSAPSLATPIASYPVDYPTVYNTEPTLYWYLGTNATGLTYEVEYVEGLNTPFTNTPNIENINSFFVKLTGLNAGSSYKWQVRSSNGINKSAWSNVASFVIQATPTIAPVIPIPSWPIGNATVYTAQTNLYWYLGTAGTGLTYEVEIRDGALTGAANILNITQLFTQALQLESGKTYTWAVRSKLGTLVSAWSLPQSFTTISTIPVATVPILSWPIGGTTVYTSTQQLSWYVNSASAGLKYDLKYSTNSDMSAATTITNIVNSQYVLTGLTAGTSYYWQVRSSDGTVHSAFSNIESFVTNAGNLPVMPITGNPINGVQLISNAPVLSWFIPTSGSIESYEVQYSDNPDMNTAVTNNCNSTSTVINGLTPNKTYYWRVRSVNADGNYSTYSNIASFVSNSVTSAENEINIINSLELSQNYPNPFNPTTTINFSIKESGIYSLEIYNMLGQKIETLVKEHLTTGNYNVNFNAQNLSSGIYFYKLNGANVNLVKKMTLIK